MDKGYVAGVCEPMNRPCSLRRKACDELESAQTVRLGPTSVCIDVPCQLWEELGVTPEGVIGGGLTFPHARAAIRIQQDDEDFYYLVVSDARDPQSHVSLCMARAGLEAIAKCVQAILKETKDKDIWAIPPR